ERALLNAPPGELTPFMIIEIVRFILPAPRNPKPISSSGVEFLRRAQAHYPANCWINIFLALGLKLHRPPRQEEAFGDCRAAVASRQESPGMHAELGGCLSALGHRDEAIIAFQKAIELQPDYAAAHHGLGEVLRDKGQLDQAITEFRKAIEL